ncbi:hypothetical protein I6G82_05720 [Lysinibacillus macroides]|nr:hypothetical protein I6G82_05720 [Lysinibacillus macroides]
MTQYVKPTMIKLGKSEKLIQGECGFGAENLTLDKTGTYWTTRKKEVHVGWLPGLVAVYQCKWTKACSSESNNC